MIFLDESDMDELRCLLHEKDDEIARLQELLEIDPGEVKRLRELVAEFVEEYRHCLQFKGANVDLFQRAKEAAGL